MTIALVASAEHNPAVSTSTPSCTLGGGGNQPGNLQTLWVAKRNGNGATFTPSGTGWSLVRRASTTAADDWPCALYYRAVPSGASATISVTTSSAADGATCQVMEFSGVTLIDPALPNGVVSEDTGGQPNINITPTAGVELLIVAFCSIRNDASPALTPVGSFNEVFDNDINNNGPVYGNGYRIVDPSTGTYNVGWTGSTSNRGVVAASFFGLSRARFRNRGALLGMTG